MKTKYSYFDKLCALSYLTMVSSNPAALQSKEVKHCADILRDR